MVHAPPRPNLRFVPRKLRLEFPGACYHVINRGNYRTDLFRTERTKAEPGGQDAYSEVPIRSSLANGIATAEKWCTPHPGPT